MPKHKKTREQKKKADERNAISFAKHQEEHIYTTPQYVFSTENQQKKEITHTTSADVLAVVTHDLKKTALISLTIVSLQILFFLLLKNHLLAISFVRY